MRPLKYDHKFFLIKYADIKFLFPLCWIFVQSLCKIHTKKNNAEPIKVKWETNQNDQCHWNTYLFCHYMNISNLQLQDCSKLNMHYERNTNMQTENKSSTEI